MIKIQNKNLQTSLDLLVYSFVFIIPLTLNLATRELFEFPKMILTYLFAVILFCVGLLRIKREQVERLPYLKPFLLLLVSWVSSTWLSTNLPTSVFGYYSRFNGGLLSLVAFFAIYLTCGVMTGKVWAKNFVYALFWSGTLISLYALLQNFGVDKDFWVQDSQARAFSTLGQPNWLAAYLLMIIPIPLYFYLEEKLLFKKIIYFLATILFYFSFWSTYSLSGFLGLLGMILLTIIYSRRLIFNKWKELLLLTFMCGLVSLARPGIFGAKFNSFIETVKPGVTLIREAAAAGAQAVKSANVKSIDTGDIRLGVWPGALNLWRQDPKTFLVGTGPETFAYNFLAFRSTTLNDTTEWDFLYNKAHNYYLDLLTGVGLLGFLAFIFYSLSVVKYCLAKIPTEGKPLLGQLLFYGWASTFVTNFFGWPTVMLSLLFFLYPLIIKHFREDPAEETENLVEIPLKRLLVSIIILIGLGLTAVNLFLADVSFSQGYSLSQSGEADEAQKALTEAVKLNAWEPAYHKELAYTYAQKYVETEDGNYLNLALKETQAAYNLNPHNSLTLRSLIRVYYLLSKVKPQYKIDLEKLALEIISLSPTEPRSYYDAALMFYYSGDKKAAEELNRGALKLRPGYPEALELAPKLEATSSAEKK